MSAFPIPESVVERLGWVLAHSLWQFALIAFLARVSLQMLRRNSSAIQYGVLCLAMFVSVVVPVATWTLVPVDSPEHPVNRSGLEFDHQSITASISSSDNVPLNSQPMLAPDKTVEPPALADTTSSSAESALEGITLVAPINNSFEPSWSEQATTFLRPWLAWIVAGWSVGVVLFSLRPLMGWYTLRRLRRVGVSPVSDEVLAALKRVSDRLGLRRVVRGLHSTLAQSPLLVGYMSPVILLPVSLATSIPTAQLEAILAHELAHVRRHDFIVNLLQTLFETVFFYHPATWWLSRRLRVEREHCCDDLVVAALGNRVEYGRALLAIEELRGHSRNTTLALGADDGSLSTRVRRILELNSQRTTFSLTERAPVALLGIVLIGILSTLWMTWNVAAEDEQKIDQDVSAEPQRVSDSLSTAPTVVGPQPEFGLGKRMERVQWSHDSKQLYSTGDFNKLTVWDHRGSGWVPTFFDVRHHANSIAVSREPPLIVVGTNVGTAEVWDATAKKQQAELRSSPNYSVYAVAISSNGKLVAACGTDGTVHVFDRKSKQTVIVLGKISDNRMVSLAFSPDGSALAALDRQGQLVLWNLPDGKQLAQWSAIAGERCSVQWSPDGKQLAVSGWGKVTLIEAKWGSQPRIVEAPEAVCPRAPLDKDESVRVFSGIESGGIIFSSVTAITRDLRTVASVAPDASIAIWELATRKIVMKLPAPEKVAIMDSQSCGLRHLAFSPNGHRLACTTLRGEVVFWQLAQADDSTMQSGKKIETAPPKGLEFLTPYPKLHSLSLEMTEQQFLAIAEQNELKTEKTREGGHTHYGIPTNDGHTIVVMFGNKGDKCSGIQQIRGQPATNTNRTDQSIALANAIRDFNAENKKLGRGLKQRPLTEGEVVAAIKKSEWKRDARNVTQPEFAAFKAVAESRRLPKDAYFQVWTSEEPATFVVIHKWQIQLYMPTSDGGFKGFTIRDTKIGEEQIDPKSVAWGKPDNDGLSLGLYFLPKKDTYQIGDRVRLRLFVRNDGKKTVEDMVFWNITWPGTKSFAVTDQTGAQIPVRNGNEEWSGPAWVAGAMGGRLRPGDAHAFRVPFEIGIGGDGSNKLVGRIIDARSGQTLKVRVRAHNGSNRKRTGDESAVPETGNLTFAVAESKAASMKREEATVVGTVTSPDGKPVAGIEVLAFQGGKQLEPKFATDERGQFRVPKAWRETDQWLTVVARDGRERLGWFDFMVHGHSDIGQKPEDGSFRLTLLPMTRTVRGRLVDESGEPLARIPVGINQLRHEVNMFAVHWRYQKLGNEPLVLGTVADKDGRFELKLPIDAFAWLGTSHPDWVEQSIRVTKDADELADTKMVRSAKVAGRVIDSRTGKPLGGIRIGARAAKTDILQSGGGEATTDADGKFVIHGLRSGKYTIHVLEGAERTLTAPAYAAATLKSGETFRADFSLSVGRRLTGRVVNLDTGEPIPNCKVNYTGPACPISGIFSIDTNKLGEFEFFVPPGKTSLDATEGRRFGAESTQDVDVPADGAPAPIVLKVGPKLESVPGSFKINVGPAK